MLIAAAKIFRRYAASAGQRILIRYAADDAASCQPPAAAPLRHASRQPPISYASAAPMAFTPPLMLPMLIAELGLGHATMIRGRQMSHGQMISQIPPNILGTILE